MPCVATFFKMNISKKKKKKGERGGGGEIVG